MAYESDLVKYQNEIKKKCMGIVNQLFDLTELSPEIRQSINDKADEYLFKQVWNILQDKKCNSCGTHIGNDCSNCQRLWES
jgi:uncharacterized protein YcbK (DUF882 family)